MTASVDDVAKQLGRQVTDPLEVNQLTSWIELAEIAIRKRYPKSSTRSLLAVGSRSAPSIWSRLWPSHGMPAIRKRRHPKAQESMTIRKR